ncbi:MAG: type II toxin-antitoxin system RelB/DinJ family antitoxin [Spartobacteria bacterium]
MTNTTTTIQIRVPIQLRDEVSAVLDSMGLDLPTAIRVYLSKVAQTRRIPFALEAEPAAEVIPVDAAIQTKMDAIGEAWRKIRPSA